MNRYRYLFKNIGLLTISNFSSKFLVFFLVPLYTNILTTEEYGIYDLCFTTISVLLPVLTMESISAMMRFALDEDRDDRELFSTGAVILARAMLVFAVLAALNRWLGLIPIFRDYTVYFGLLFFAASVESFLSRFARGVEDIPAVAIGGCVSTVVCIVCNILFLVVFRWGLAGYFLANTLAPAASSVFFCVRLRVAGRLRWRWYRRDTAREMVSYGRPLVFNSISWWVNNVADRYVITAICGVAVNGIYSVAYKIPAILNVFFTVFNQAWLLSSVKNYDEEDAAAFYSNIYNGYQFGLLCVSSALIFGTRIIGRILFAKEFYPAWQYVPALLIAVFFSALIGMFNSIFAAAKQVRICAVSSLAGAVFNVLVSLWLTWRIGAQGAAIGTAAAHYLMWLILLAAVLKLVPMQIRLVRDHMAYGVLVLQGAALVLMEESLLSYGVQALCLAAMPALYHRELFRLLGKLRQLWLKQIQTKTGGAL